MCFSLDWIEHLLIMIVIIGAIVALLRLVIPWAFSLFGTAAPSILVSAINIILWAFIAIIIIIFIFSLISCLLGMGGGGFTLFPRHG